jgi:hypothetical protein
VERVIECSEVNCGEKYPIGMFTPRGSQRVPRLYAPKDAKSVEEAIAQAICLDCLDECEQKERYQALWYVVEDLGVKLGNPPWKKAKRKPSPRPVQRRVPNPSPSRPASSALKGADRRKPCSKPVRRTSSKPVSRPARRVASKPRSKPARPALKGVDRRQPARRTKPVSQANRSVLAKAVRRGLPTQGLVDTQPAGNAKLSEVFDGEQLKKALPPKSKVKPTSKAPKPEVEAASITLPDDPYPVGIPDLEEVAAVGGQALRDDSYREYDWEDARPEITVLADKNGDPIEFDEESGWSIITVGNFTMMVSSTDQSIDLDEVRRIYDERGLPVGYESVNWEFEIVPPFES